MDVGASLSILDMKIDTTAETGALMLKTFSSVAQFEGDIMLERQRMGIEAAKARDSGLPLAESTYRGAPPNMQAKSRSIKALSASGATKAQVARDPNFSIASVYWVSTEAAGGPECRLRG